MFVTWPSLCYNISNKLNLLRNEWFYVRGFKWKTNWDFWIYQRTKKHQALVVTGWCVWQTGWATFYKIVRNGQFVYVADTSRRGDKIALAMNSDKDCIVSAIYTVFEVNDKSLNLGSTKT